MSAHSEVVVWSPRNDESQDDMIIRNSVVIPPEDVERRQQAVSFVNGAAAKGRPRGVGGGGWVSSAHRGLLRRRSVLAAEVPADDLNGTMQECAILIAIQLSGGQQLEPHEVVAALRHAADQTGLTVSRATADAIAERMALVSRRGCL